MTESDSVVLDKTEALRIANSLELLYYRTEESAYDQTDKQAAKDAMMIRERIDFMPNPELLKDGDTE